MYKLKMYLKLLKPGKKLKCVKLSPCMLVKKLNKNLNIPYEIVCHYVCQRSGKICDNLVEN